MKKKKKFRHVVHFPRLVFLFYIPFRGLCSSRGQKSILTVYVSCEFSRVSVSFSTFRAVDVLVS